MKKSCLKAVFHSSDVDVHLQGKLIASGASSAGVRHTRHYLPASVFQKKYLIKPQT